MNSKCYMLLVLILWIGERSFCQEKPIFGTIHGSVIDNETQNPLPYANIWLEGTTLGTITDTLGNFVISHVPVGNYNICAKMIGYNSTILPDVEVISKKTCYVKFTMEIEITELDEVTIRQKVFARNSTLGMNSINSISSAEIRNTPGVPDLFRRIQSVAGVGRATDFSPALIVRGSDPEENLTYIEGIQIYSPFHFSNLGGTAMSDGMSIIEPKLVQKVNVSTGGFSSRYGDGLSSVTEIVLSEPEMRKLGGNISFDMGGVSSNLSGSVNDRFSWLWGGRLGMWEMFMKMQGRDYHPTTKDSHLKLIYKPSKKHKLKLYGLYVSDKMWRIKKDDDLEDIHEEKYRDLNKNTSALGINWQWLYSKRGYVSVTPYMNINNWEMTEGTLDEKELFGYANNEDFYGLRGEVLYRLNLRNRILLGTEYRKISTKYNQWAPADTLQNGLIRPPYDISFSKENTYKYSTFITYFYSPKNWLHFTTGIRQDYFQFTNSSSWSPRIGASMDITKSFKTNAAIGIYRQFPQFYKVFLSPYNESLESSQSVHYIVGFEYLINPDMQIKVEGYFKDLSKLPVQERESDFVYKSIGGGYSRGLEFTLTQKMTGNLYLLVNYSISESVRKDSSNGNTYPFIYDSPHVLNVMATYRTNKRWEISLISRYSSGFPYTPFDIDTKFQLDNKWYCLYGGKNASRLPDYYRLDVRIDRRFIYKNWNLSLFLEVWNITNNENVMKYEYNSDFTAKESVPSMFGLMPMFGMLAEF